MLFREIMVERGILGRRNHKFWYAMQKKVGNKWVKSPTEEWKPFLFRLEKTQPTRWMQLNKSKTLASIAYFKVMLENVE
jgi:hypothetical protein